MWEVDDRFSIMAAREVYYNIREKDWENDVVSLGFLGLPDLYTVIVAARHVGSAMQHDMRGGGVVVFERVYRMRL